MPEFVTCRYSLFMYSDAKFTLMHAQLNQYHDCTAGCLDEVIWKKL